MDFPVNLEGAFAPLGGRLQREPERDLWVFDLDDYVLRVEPFLLRPKARLILGLDCTVGPASGRATGAVRRPSV